MPESQTDVAAGLDRIESAVASGNTDLRELGFWKVVGQVKRDPALIEADADQISRIDRAAFEARVRPRFPVWFGNTVLIAGMAFGALAILVAQAAASQVVAGLALIVAAGAWSISVHSFAHWAVGRAVGIHFTSYFFGGPPPPRPGIKTDYGTYLRTPPRKRALMHASGALATKVAPFVVLAFYPSTNAPAWAAWIVLAIGLVQIVTDVVLSTKSSDWKKVKRELRAARAAG